MFQPSLHNLAVVELNKEVWSRGVANPPRRVRIRCTRRLNEDEDAAETHYTLVSLVKTAKASDFKGVGTKVVDEQ